MSDKTPTEMLIDALCDAVYVELADDFVLEDGETDFNVRRDVRLGVKSVLESAVVAVYTSADFCDRFEIVTGHSPLSHGFRLDAGMQILNDVVHGREMAEAFEYLLDKAIIEAVDG